MRRVLWIAMMLTAPCVLGGGLSGCGASDADRDPTGREATKESATAGSTALRPATPPVAPPAVVHGPALGVIAGRVATAASQRLPQDKATLRALLSKQRHDRKVLSALYGKGKLRHYQADGRLTEAGAQLLDRLAELDHHGVDQRPYRLASLDAATANVIKALKAERAAILKIGEDPTVAKVAAAAAVWARGGPAGEVALVQAGGDKLDGAARKALAEHLPTILARGADVRRAMWTADLRLTGAAIRYVIDFTLAKPAHPHDYLSPAALRKVADRAQDDILARLSKPDQSMSEALRALWPKPPQYRRLLKAVTQYQRLVKAGGWEKLPPLGRKKLEKGMRSPFVVALRRRLIAEGYPAEADGDRYDQTLLAVVIEFQRRHQLTEDGGVGRGTIAALDVTAEQRVRQLKLALTRWRSAYARDAEGFFIQVNIAAQRVKIYDNSKMVREHRVIVGKDNDDIDFDKRVKGKINRTRLFKAKMKRITLAPRWYPTPRVIDLELGPALARDPDYFEKHGYVSEMQADGSERVYQRAGRSNLLGVVKFQFPNKHAIYMHDTPSRSLFKRARRAYSHGCVRLHKPKQLAYYLLGKDRGWGRRKIDEIIKKREEKVVGLRKHFWVYIDYISATVDKRGDVRFWSDIYGYDLAYFTGQLPVQEIQDYKSASIRGL